MNYCKLSEAQDAYIEFLENYMRGVNAYLQTRHLGPTQADIDKGVELRAAIEAAKNEPEK
jgi:hypothetical protein